MKIQEISVYLPNDIRTTRELLSESDEVSVQSFIKKIGIKQRHFAGRDEYVSDMSVAAAEKLFETGIKRETVDYIILCTQSPDYLLPTTACLVQDRLRLRKNIGAIDVNLGCSGYIYALSLAYGLIESKQVSTILLITSDTYSKFISCSDASVKTIFGDAATATLITATSSCKQKVSFIFGTDGSGAENFILKNSGVRKTEPSTTTPKIQMNGSEMIKFILQAIPDAYYNLLVSSGMAEEDIKYFVFHQANLWVLNLLKKQLKIPTKRFMINLDSTGNTTASTVPIVLKKLMNKVGFSIDKDPIMLMGFGVGYSWAGCLMNV